MNMRGQCLAGANVSMSSQSSIVRAGTMMTICHNPTTVELKRPGRVHAGGFEQRSLQYAHLETIRAGIGKMAEVLASPRKIDLTSRSPTQYSKQPL